MSYNWIDAATPQGRERLEELADSGKNVVAKLNGHEGILYNVLANMPNPFKRPKWYSFIQRLGNIYKPIEWYIENGIEFLDPEPRQPEPELKPLEWMLSESGQAANAGYCPLVGFVFAQSFQADAWELVLSGTGSGDFPTFEALSTHVEALRHEALKKLLK